MGSHHGERPLRVLEPQGAPDRNSSPLGLTLVVRLAAPTRHCSESSLSGAATVLIQSRCCRSCGASIAAPTILGAGDLLGDPRSGLAILSAAALTIGRAP